MSTSYKYKVRGSPDQRRCVGENPSVDTKMMGNVEGSWFDPRVQTFIVCSSSIVAEQLRRPHHLPIRETFTQCHQDPLIKSSDATRSSNVFRMFLTKSITC